MPANRILVRLMTIVSPSMTWHLPLSSLASGKSGNRTGREGAVLGTGLTLGWVGQVFCARRLAFIDARKKNRKIPIEIDRVPYNIRLKRHRRKGDIVNIAVRKWLPQTAILVGYVRSCQIDLINGGRERRGQENSHDSR